MSKKRKWIDIYDDLTKEGRKEIKTGQVLIFSKDDEERAFKVKRRTNRHFWVEPIILYYENELEVVDNK